MYYRKYNTYLVGGNEQYFRINSMLAQVQKDQILRHRLYKTEIRYTKKNHVAMKVCFQAMNIHFLTKGYSSIKKL